MRIVLNLGIIKVIFPLPILLDQNKAPPEDVKTIPVAIIIMIGAAKAIRMRARKISNRRFFKLSP